MPAINRAEFEARHDTDFAYEIAGLARFRANVFRIGTAPARSSASSRPTS